MKAIINAKIVMPDEIMNGVILTDGGIITAVGDIAIPRETEIIDAEGLFVGPGLVDEHVHGYNQHGICVDVRQDCNSVADNHLLHGTTSITPSAAYSYSKEEIIQIANSCNEAIESGKSSIIGIHYEGPFINNNQGAHAEKAWSYSDEVFQEIIDAARGNLLHCTYAPEMENASRLESILEKNGIVADIGHTLTGPKDAERAVSRGARIVTHLFDAMGCYLSPESAELTGDLQEQVSSILLSMPGLYYELICDSRYVHVKEVSIRLAYRTAGEDGIILVSDATGERGVNLIAEYPEDDPRNAKDLNWNDLGQLSGSRLTLIDGVRNFMRATGADVRVGFKCASTNPAKAIKMDHQVGSISAGKLANLIFVDEQFNLKKVIFRGNILPNTRSKR
jgi:N-acetylglucosamine-6-phosphate deacetylase